MNAQVLGASFRDPCGFLFTSAGTLYRQVNFAYRLDYDLLLSSGLYKRLVSAGLLVSHTEVRVEPASPGLAYKVVEPEMVAFISYPYEWSFSELKDAALATLKIQKIALELGMSLKDASAYNIQFQRGKPCLIDTLSFEIYKVGKPWVAYRQFCQHFLAPLSLMAYRDIRLSQLLRVYVDGIPLDLASRLLPPRAQFNFGLLSHIFLHARAQKTYADKSGEKPKINIRMSKQSLLGLVESLESAVENIKWNPSGTEWGDYYDKTNYSDKAFLHKKQLVSDWMDRIKPGVAWDLGANTGIFSRLVSLAGGYTIAFDIDPAAVEQNYRQVRIEKEQKVLPLILDLTNPSPAMGWNNQERLSLGERGPVEVVLALALIHHLAISNNVPLSNLAEFFYELCHWLVIEFVPKSDSQVQKLLKSREDIFPHYVQGDFEAIFREKFEIREAIKVQDSDRYLYLMESRKAL
ncbi:MAG: SAM-dependent methyltransferase [Anaerolineales bacterium]|jgi:ribosomal protein L11 methylase PrmA